MNFASIILVWPVCLHFHFSTFSRLSAGLACNIFRFRLTISMLSCKNYNSHEILAFFACKVSFNLHAIHSLIVSSNFTEIDLIH